MDQPPEMDVAQARAALDAGKHVFVDIRDPDSYKEEHIPGALHLDDSNVADFVGKADK